MHELCIYTIMYIGTYLLCIWPYFILYTAEQPGHVDTVIKLKSLLYSAAPCRPIIDVT